MRAAWTIAALCALLLVSVQPANAGLLDAVKDAAETVGGAVANTTTDAVDTVKETAVDVKEAVVAAWDSVVGWSKDAWDKAKTAFTDAKTWVECTAVDWTVFDLEPCLEAPAGQLCTESCKSNLNQLPQACADKIVAEAYARGDTLAFERLTEQMSECGTKFALPAGAALKAIPFAITSQGCAGVDWAAANMTACTGALDEMDTECPPECTAVLDKLSPECKATLQANATAGASEEEAIAQMLADACGVVAAPAPAPAAAA